MFYCFNHDVWEAICLFLLELLLVRMKMFRKYRTLGQLYCEKCDVKNVWELKEKHLEWKSTNISYVIVQMFYPRVCVLQMPIKVIFDSTSLV